ncbi:MAG: glycosyltransferase family 2 protein [Eubacteriales bacterium]|nr:glycosyltransferase family 2 protein [Eubacteriales bacterium]
MKLLSIAIPCYNSEAYMEKCIDSLLAGGDDVEILIVNDGSTDRTAEIADRYQVLNPNIVRVIHKENGGHGSAVNAGIENATGLFFKVVDSDDWVKESAYQQVLDTLRELAGGEQQLDMMVCNFVYNKVGEKRHKVMQYRSSLPVGQMFTWKEVKHFYKGHYILMHSVIFRTRLLHECGLKLPEHCFYVDNIYVFNPLPYVKNMYYLDVNFYYYYIGRTDQSVNQKVMISRIDQQLRVNKLMVDYYTDKSIRPRIDACSQLRNYMYNYLEIITTISCVLAICSYTPEDLAKKKDLWSYIKEKDYWLFMKLRTGIFGISMNLPGKGGRYFTVGAYKIARHFFNFN